MLSLARMLNIKIIGLFRKPDKQKTWCSCDAEDKGTPEMRITLDHVQIKKLAEEMEHLPPSGCAAWPSEPRYGYP